MPMSERNVTALQDTLDRLNAKIERWEQGRWCDLRGVVDPITDEHLNSLTYHDFELTSEFADWYRSLTPNKQETVPLPVADCGTSYCVAGDVCVANGYVFVAESGEGSATRVIQKDHVKEFMENKPTTMTHDDLSGADKIATDILGLTHGESRIMFAAQRSLPELWALGYAFTNGRITLPETLPESKRLDDITGVRRTVAATDNATDTRHVIFTALRDLAFNNWKSEWRRLAERELARLRVTSDS